MKEYISFNLRKSCYGHKNPTPHSPTYGFPLGAYPFEKHQTNADVGKFIFHV